MEGDDRRDDAHTPTEHVAASQRGDESADLDRIERTWNGALAHDAAAKDFVTGPARLAAGLAPPSSLIGSAEGYLRFQGLRINGNGNLDEISRLVIRNTVGKLDVAALEDQPRSGTPDKKKDIEGREE